MPKRRYAIVIERGAAGGGYSAYVPDLPGCVTVGESIEEVREAMREAIALHLHGLHEEGAPIPDGTSLADHVEIEDDPKVWSLGVTPVAPPRKARAHR